MRMTIWIATLVLASMPASGSLPTRYSGEAVIRSIAPTRIAVLVDTDRDKTVDNGFLLTTDIPMGAGLAVRLASARIEYAGGYVRVTGDGKVYVLQVAGHPEPPAAPSDQDLVTLIGSDLVHSSGDSGCDLERAHERDAGACFAYGRQ